MAAVSFRTAAQGELIIALGQIRSELEIRPSMYKAVFSHLLDPALACLTLFKWKDFSFLLHMIHPWHVCFVYMRHNTAIFLT